MTMEPITSAPPRFRPPEYGDPYYVAIVQTRPDESRTEHRHVTYANCLECGASVREVHREVHDAFHERLFRAACRG